MGRNEKKQFLRPRCKIAVKKVWFPVKNFWKLQQNFQLLWILYVKKERNVQKIWISRM